MTSTDPAPVERTFGLPALAYDAPVQKQRYLRISMFFNKKPGISYAYFQQHWHNFHGDLVTSSDAFKSNKILRYNQFHQTPENKALARRLGDGSYPSVDFDACTEFWVEKIEDFEAFSKSKEYTDGSRKLSPLLETRRVADATIADMENFVNIPDGVKLMIGYDNLVFGEAVPGYGENGVVRSDLEKVDRLRN